MQYRIKIVQSSYGKTYWVQRKRFFFWKNLGWHYDEHSANRDIKERLTPDIISYMEPK